MAGSFENEKHHEGKKNMSMIPYEEKTLVYLP